MIEPQLENVSLLFGRTVYPAYHRSERIESSTILAECEYYHPVFTVEPVAAQQRKSEIDGKNSRYFVGAYRGYRFHEDSARTACEVAQLLKQL